MRNRLITFEGGEGTGKSTQARMLAERLRSFGEDVVVTREPGGSPDAERIREFILSGNAKPFGAFAEAALFSAARVDHLRHTIRPALERGAWVVCDRFIDSTRAYQGALGNLDPGILRALERVVLDGTMPGLTLLLDLPPEQGLERARRRTSAAPDRFESEDLDYHRSLRHAFLDIASADPERVAVIDASGPPEAVAEQVWAAGESRFGTIGTADA
jgi:dTMP kinase